MLKASPGNSLWSKLRDLGFDDQEVISLVYHMCGGYSGSLRTGLTFSKTEVVDDKNVVREFATLSFNKRGQLKEFRLAEEFSTEIKQSQFLEPILRWHSGQLGQIVLSRPLFALLPLKGMYISHNHFQIRPIKSSAKIGKGLDFEARAVGKKFISNLGPPFPFILEVKAKKSDEASGLSYKQGLQLLTEYESLLSVLLVQHISSHRILLGKKWTSIWQGEEVSYHLLQGGFDSGEEGSSGDFFVPACNEVPRFEGVDYYNHLFGGDDQITLPPNFNELLLAFEGLAKPVRRAFLRACYWFSLGIQHRQETALSIVAFSSAIECLLPRQNRKPCESCKKPKGKGPTKLFNEHLEKYAPILPSLEPQRQKIYEVRSKLVHGSNLEATDFDWLSPMRRERDNAFLIEFVARRSLVNWLADPERNDPTLSSIEG